MTSVSPTDDELDELLDDAFEQFTVEAATPKAPTNNSTNAKPTTNPLPPPPAAAASRDATDSARFQEDFAQQLAKGMESLLKDGGNLDNGSDKNMKKTLDDLLQQLGTIQADMGLHTPAPAPTQQQPQAASSAPSVSEKAAPGSFQDKIKATMDKLKESASEADSAGSAGDAGIFDELMRQMEGMEGLGDDPQLDSLVDDVIGQLMSKDVLSQPLKDLDTAYPAYLKKNKDSLSAEEYGRYEKQHAYVRQILALFDATEGDTVNPRIAELMQEMQDCGQPPDELLKLLAPDMDISKGEVKEPEAPNCCVM
ncbi:Peroxisome chaperone and import receptor [Kickxella alabastrina]|uniref:Peroxisome chaperone and import receptor n=1 Tax=Kickxella alabastrina TaxID=61397 RepID=A0ACC1I700_9FUNG|nr:Peroxisome chaperone and import receptor [Kickxella alabastrina]